MIKMSRNWENLFESRILERGYNYYLSDSIENIRLVDDKIFATVRGTDDYQVEVELDEDDTPWIMECSCPYSKDFIYCKHIACVCYHIEENNIPKVSSDNFDRTRFEYTLDYNSFVDYVDDQIDTFEFDDLKYFLNNLIVENRNVFRDFMSFRNHFSKEDEVIYEQMLNSILYREVKVKGNKKFINELSDFVCYDLPVWCSNESYDFVIFLVSSILIRLAMITYMSETKELEDIIDKLDDVLSHITKLNNIKYNNQISDIFKDIADKYSDTIFIDKFTDLFKKYTIKDSSRMMIKLLEKQLEEEDNYYKLDKIKEILELMEKAKYSNEEIISFLKDYVNVEGCEILLSKYYVKNGEKNKAILLLRSFCSDGFYDPRSMNALEELKKIYLKDNDESYVQCIEHEIYIHHLYSKENIDLLREYYKSNWNIQRNKIIKHYQENLHDYNLYNFFLNEGNYEEFKRNIFSNSKFHELRKYHDILVERFPDELYETYRMMVEDLLLESKPKNYKESAEILKQMKKMPDKEESVKDFIDKLKELYPRRTRMIKEFEKV